LISQAPNQSGWMCVKALVISFLSGFDDDPWEA
jgi:hypothetical protein